MNLKARLLRLLKKGPDKAGCEHVKLVQGIPLWSKTVRQSDFKILSKYRVLVGIFCKGYEDRGKNIYFFATCSKSPKSSSSDEVLIRQYLFHESLELSTDQALAWRKGKVTSPPSADTN